MINIKKIIDPIRDSGVSLQERLFRLLTLVGRSEESRLGKE